MFLNIYFLPEEVQLLSQVIGNGKGNVEPDSNNSTLERKKSSDFNRRTFVRLVNTVNNNFVFFSLPWLAPPLFPDTSFLLLPYFPSLFPSSQWPAVFLWSCLHDSAMAIYINQSLHGIPLLYA